MSESESKHVQTELTGEEYELFREFADEQGMSLKEAGREALVTWIERQQRADPTDQAFTVLNELDDEALPASAETDARTVDNPVSKWNGDDAEFILVDEPEERTHGRTG